MGIILIFQTVTTCIIAGTISKRFWFSYILFLVFIGGILILFIYISSLASNEKLNFSSQPLIKFLIIFNITVFITIFIDKFYTLNYLMNEDINNISFNYLINENFLSLSKMYDQPNNFIILILIIYLLLTLVIVVKITNLFIGPLRPKSY